jgi:diguanylate cyclase (GGDEF)-like protein/PAS domain S-box-containing protein
LDTDRAYQQSEAGAADGEIDGIMLAPATLLEGLPDAVVATGRDERIVFANSLAEELFGYPREELIGRPVQTLWPERFRERYTRNMRLYFATEDALRFTTEAWGRCRDGSEFVGEMSWGIVPTTQGPLLLAVGRDITGQRLQEARLRAVAALGERALAGADAISLAAEAVDLMRTLPVVGAEVRLAGGGVLASTGLQAEPGLRFPIGSGEALLVAPDREFGDAEVGLARAVANTLATALERLRGDERVRYDAVHDPLTGLANRTLLGDRLAHAVAKAARTGSSAAVLFVDLDNFKAVNDHHGHAVGDAVLTELARRIAVAIRPGDTAARYGGDEFVAICEEIDEVSARQIAARILEAVRAPLSVGRFTHELSASIGLAVGRHDPEELLADADAAAYRAKANGRGRVEVL